MKIKKIRGLYQKQIHFVSFYTNLDAIKQITYSFKSLHLIFMKQFVIWIYINIRACKKFMDTKIKFEYAIVCLRDCKIFFLF